VRGDRVHRARNRSAAGGHGHRSVFADDQAGQRSHHAGVLAGDGSTAEDEEEVAMVERLLEISAKTIRIYLDAQIQAGAKAIILCEPAANKVYFSPNQLEESYADVSTAT
jgi:hypothetical protein